jgi:hypothetical protein
MARHIIKRQVLELHTNDEGNAQRLQHELSRIMRERLIPLLDQYCTQMSGSDEIYRIDSLEIDLGVVSSKELEHALTKRVGELLRPALQEQIRTSGKQSEVRLASYMELLAFFVQTGGLPWWADHGEQGSQPTPIQRALRYVMDADLSKLRHMLQSLNAESMQRLVNHISDDDLSALLTQMLANFADKEAVDIAPLTPMLASAGVGAARRVIWTNALRTASTVISLQSVKDFHRVLFAAIATSLGIPNTVFLTMLLRSSALHPQNLSHHSPLHNAIRDGVNATHTTDADSDTPLSDALIQRLEHLEAQGGDSARLWAALRLLIPQLALVQQYQLMTLVQTLKGGDSPAVAAGRLRGFFNGIAPASVRAWETNLRRDSLLSEYTHGTDSITDVLQTLIAQSAAQRGDASVDRASVNSAAMPDALADVLYIDNAGLVILWAFLRSFFFRLDLLAEKDFKDVYAQQRAVALLQHLVTGRVNFQEYELPLNKVLCGMRLDSVFELENPLTDAEIQECDIFLTAVIQQAPILRNMTVDGFRSTFLRRKGSVGRRDGMWLVQVERETYDLVLDRFPWTWEWLKLPWMEAPLRVEW